MKIKNFWYVLITLVSINSFSQNNFNCVDFDYYNKDTSLIVNYDIIYDSLTQSEIKVFGKLVDDLATIEDDAFVDTVIIPRYGVILSENDDKKLEQLVLCSLDWLLTFKMESDKAQWSKIEKFVLSSHSVSVIINEEIIKSLQSKEKDNEMILNYYRLGVIRHITLKTYEPDYAQIQLAGLLALNQLYENNPELIGESPQILTDYRKNYDKEKLLRWISKFED